jgi:hypothetical protein
MELLFRSSQARLGIGEWLARALFFSGQSRDHFGVLRLLRPALAWRVAYLRWQGAQKRADRVLEGNSLRL